MAVIPERPRWQIGDWVANPNDDTLSRDGAAVRLEPRIMQLLVCLAESAPQIVSVDRLLTEVWSGVIVGPASVYQTVSQLRKILGDTETPPQYIETVARKGYRLIATARSLAVVTSPNQGTEQRGSRRRALMAALSAALLAALLAIAWYWWRPNDEAITVRRADSIVVLPFLDLSPAKSELAFCDGLTEEITSWLSQLPAVQVVARTSAFAYRDRQQDVRVIGRELGTTHVLEGSVRGAGDDLRITVKLISTANGYQLWAESFDATHGNILGVQEKIARAVATNLEVRLTQQVLTAMTARRGADERAYRQYLLGLQKQQAGSRADNEQAVALFRNAIKADPAFALAYAHLAAAYIDQRYYSNRAIAEIAADVEPLVDQAARLQPNLPETYIVRAALANELARPADASRQLQRALQLNENSTAALKELGYLKLTNGEPRAAQDYYSRAIELDPVSGYLYAQRCMALTDLARYAEADRACDRSRTLTTGAAWPLNASAALEEARGRIDAALGWNAAALRISPDLTSALSQRSLWLLNLGLVSDAREVYNEAVATVGGDRFGSIRLLEAGFNVTLAEHGAAALGNAVSAMPGDKLASPEIRLQVAEAALFANNPRLARKMVDAALADPALEPALLNSAWLARFGKSYQITAATAKILTGDSAAAASHLASLDRLLDQVANDGMRRAGIEELRAQAAALRNDPQAARQHLQAAIALGWSGAWRVRYEPYWASVRERAGFQALLQQVSASNDAMRSRLGSHPVPTP